VKYPNIIEPSEDEALDFAGMFNRAVNAENFSSDISASAIVHKVEEILEKKPAAANMLARHRVPKMTMRLRKVFERGLKFSGVKGESFDKTKAALLSNHVPNTWDSNMNAIAHDRRCDTAAANTNDAGKLGTVATELNANDFGRTVKRTAANGDTRGCESAITSNGNAGQERSVDPASCSNDDTACGADTASSENIETVCEAGIPSSAKDVTSSSIDASDCDDSVEEGSVDVLSDNHKKWASGNTQANDSDGEWGTDTFSGIIEANGRESVAVQSRLEDHDWAEAMIAPSGCELGWPGTDAAVVDIEGWDRDTTITGFSGGISWRYTAASTPKDPNDLEENNINSVIEWFTGNAPTAINDVRSGTIGSVTMPRASYFKDSAIGTTEEAMFAADSNISGWGGGTAPAGTNPSRLVGLAADQSNDDRNKHQTKYPDAGFTARTRAALGTGSTAMPLEVGNAVGVSKIQIQPISNNWDASGLVNTGIKESVAGSWSSLQRRDTPNMQVETSYTAAWGVNTAIKVEELQDAEIQE
jgi:hypothetical protein